MSKSSEKTDRAPTSRSVPRGPSWTTLASLSLVALAALVIGVTLAKPIRTGLSRSMNVLNRSDNAHAGHAHTQGDSAQTQYTCGMHPWVILPEPGDCPICHMKLVPLDPSKTTSDITIDPAITQRIGVRTTPAILTSAHRNIQTTGSVTWDESALHEVTLKYTGWIEKLHVDTVGQPVKKGQLLFEIYAPAVYVAQEEYLTIWRNRNAATGQSSPRLLDAAKRRLRFLDVTEEQIDALEKRNESQKTIAVFSPADGYVVERNITQGASVEMDRPLFRIADIAKVWVMAAVYEQDLPLIHPDMHATMSLPYSPGKTYEGTLAYVYPYLDNASRQASARLVFDNPDHRLKPGMFARINLHAQLDGERLLIPRSAVIDTGKRQRVFVAQKLGRFEPRAVTLGANVQDGLVEVLEGIAVGENVVTQSQFLLDSEANMRQTLAMMTTPSDKNTAAADTQSGEKQTLTLTTEKAATLNTLIDTYLAMSDQLASNENDVSTLAQKLGELAGALPDVTQAQAIAKMSKTFDKPDALAPTREKFLKLSLATLDLLNTTGVPDNRTTPVEQLECEMYQHNVQGEKIPAGGRWISPAGKVRNPYFGPMMLGCFTDQAKLPIAKVIAPNDSNTQNHENHQ